MIRHFVRLVPLALLAVTACDDPGDPDRDLQLDPIGETSRAGVVGSTPEIAVVVLEDGSDAASGVTIEWTASAGTLSDESSSTDVDGHATIAWTLPTTPQQATLVARIGGSDESTTFTVDVAAGAPAAITIVDGGRTLAGFGDTITLSATAVDAYGNTTAFTPQWSSTDSIVARVDENGFVVAGGGGTTTILASSGNVSGGAVVQVPMPVVLRTLTCPAGTSPSANPLGMNETGLLVGHCGDFGVAADRLPVRWSTAVGAPMSNDSTHVAYSVNAAGVAVGRSARLLDIPYALRWDAAGQVDTLLANAFAWQINDAGDIAGIIDPFSTSGTEAFVIRNGVVDTLADAPSWARGINAVGQVAGSIGTGVDQSAVVWSATGVPSLLARPVGYQTSAYAINDAGMTVGRASISGPDAYLVWNADGLLAYTYFPPLAASTIIIQYAAINEYGTALVATTTWGYLLAHGIIRDINAVLGDTDGPPRTATWLTDDHHLLVLNENGSAQLVDLWPND